MQSHLKKITKTLPRCTRNPAQMLATSPQSLSPQIYPAPPSRNLPPPKKSLKPRKCTDPPPTVPKTSLQNVPKPRVGFWYVPLIVRHSSLRAQQSPGM